MAYEIDNWVMDMFHDKQFFASDDDVNSCSTITGIDSLGARIKVSKDDYTTSKMKFTDYIEDYEDWKENTHGTRFLTDNEIRKLRARYDEAVGNCKDIVTATEWNKDTATKPLINISNVIHSDFKKEILVDLNE